MKLCFDYQAFTIQTHGGVSRSFAELISCLRSEGNKCILGIKESDNVHLREKNLVPDLKSVRYRYNKWFGHEQYFHGEDRIKRFLMKVFNYQLEPNNNYCIRLLNRQDFDVFHPTFYDPYFLKYLKDKPFVLTVHDMMPELFPNFYSQDSCQVVQKKKLCQLASGIHVPSYRTKEDFVNILNIDPDRVTVIHHGFSRTAFDAFDCKLNIDYPYLLYVGNRFGYKNFKYFIAEYSRVAKDFKDVHLVCTGERFTSEEMMFIDQYKVGPKVHHVFASESEMQYLYSHAIAFVYPSAYEGFGMPILEAYSNNCPVLLKVMIIAPQIC